MRYRKKPIVIEATQWFKHCDHPMVEKDLRHVTDSRHGLIKTLEDSYDGAHFVEPGDWIITGIAGEHYACKDHIFKATYELEESQSDLARLMAENERLRDFVQAFADEPCHYGDNCTDEAMRQRRHGKCTECLARAALKGEPK